MRTRMTEEDGATVLEVFRACRSRRGAKGRNDRIFLEALHSFAVHDITWRALPETVGNRNSVWKRFWRLSQAGVFEAFFDALAATSRTAPLVQRLAFTVVRAHVSAAGAKGGSKIRRWAARAGAFRPRSTSRLISVDGRWRSTSRRLRRATARGSRSCSTSGPTSRRGLRWVTKAMMPRPTAQRRVSAVFVR